MTASINSTDASVRLPPCRFAPRRLERARSTRSGYLLPACVQKNVPASFALNARKKVGHSMNTRTSAVIFALTSALTACGETTPPAEAPEAAVAEQRAEKAEDATS